MKRILVLGGYGNFGRFICNSLASQKNIQLIIAGRSKEKATIFAATFKPKNKVETAIFDVHHQLAKHLSVIKPHIVIHTSGPFQHQSYGVAEACIKFGAHYIDLSDGRAFVSNIHTLNAKAKQANVLVVSGASSVPCLTSAIVEYYKKEFDVLDTLSYGITTAQKTTRGLATTAAILSYTGKPFTTLVDGKKKIIYGWQGLHNRKYLGLKKRLLGNCNIPDLALFPKMYPQLKTIRFYAGLEIPLVHITLWALSWLVRIGLIKRLERFASLLLKLSFLFDLFGSANSGFYMQLKGKGKKGNTKNIDFELIAKEGDGPYIPCMPAILLAKKLANNEMQQCGATPCVNLITLDEYLKALKPLNIHWSVKGLHLNSRND